MRLSRSLATLAAISLATIGCRSAAKVTSDIVQMTPKRVTHRGQSIGNQLVLHGDHSFPPNHRLIKELTAQREIINQRLELPQTDRPIHVYLFVDEDSYRENVVERYPQFPQRRAIFVDDGVQLAVYAQKSEQVAIDLRHEVAHGYLHAAVPHLPLWLDEGLAEYFEVARGQDGVNRPHVEFLLGQRDVAGWKPDLARLESLVDADKMTQLDYAEAWLWVHFLLASTDQPSIVAAYLGDLRREETPQPISARIDQRYAHPEPALLEHLELMTQ